MTDKKILNALRFAARKHSGQTRKNRALSPYVDHPIEVAWLVVAVGEVDDSEVVMAAFLHDTVEDTETTFEEIEKEFGTSVMELVREMTDDKSLPKERRKELQVEHALHLSDRAKVLKLADKIANVRDVSSDPPSGWSVERRMAYLDWTEAVIAGCRGVNEPLEELYDRVLEEGRKSVASD